MKDYYNVLKISRNATEVEIKKSYRALALKYHPDKNPHNKSIVVIQEINEAYEVLSDQDKKWWYDQKYDYYFGSGIKEETSYNVPPTYESPPQSDRYTSPAEPFSYSRPQYAPSTKVDFTPYIPFFKAVNLAAFILCFMLFFDYILPMKFINEEVIGLDRYHEALPSSDTDFNKKYYEGALVMKTSRFEFEINGAQGSKVELGDEMTIYITPLFKITKLIEFKDKYIAFSPSYGIYNTFLFIPLILFAMSCIGVFAPDHHRLVIDLGAANLVMIIFLVIPLIFIS